MEDNSEICEFLEGKTVLITGGTGFMGKVLLETLLRIGRLKTIYFLVRDKKGVPVKDRLEKLFSLPLFEKILETEPSCMQKIVPIIGDCIEERLGLDNGTYHTLVEEVEVVFHLAATVRFDQDLKTAAYINIRALRDLLEMSRSMSKLKAFVHVSTAYSNCNRSEIDEIFYKPPITAENILKLVESLSAEQIEAITPSLLGDFPNTYTFTKCIAEELISKHRCQLPVAVVRPSIVTSCYKEPIPGWIDSFYGPSGIMTATGFGVLRVLHCNPDKNADIVPLDYVINNLLAVAWSISKRDYHGGNQIFNYVCGPEKPITWGDFIDRCINYYPTHAALDTSIWYTFCLITKNKFLFQIADLFLHTIPAHIIDTVAIIRNKKPMLVEGYKKIEKMQGVLVHFMHNDFKFSNRNTTNLWLELNPQDRKTFQFSMRNFDWDEYIIACELGVRLYLLKRPIDTIEKGIRRQRTLKVIHYTTVTATVTTIFILLWFLINCIY